MISIRATALNFRDLCLLVSGYLVTRDEFSHGLISVLRAGAAVPVKATKPLVGREVLKPEPVGNRSFVVPPFCHARAVLAGQVRCTAEAGEEESRLRADLASRVLSGPGLWTDWLDDLDRRGLIEELLADGVIDQAVAAAPHGHQLDRALNAKSTVLSSSWPGACSRARATTGSCASPSACPS